MAIDPSRSDGVLWTQPVAEHDRPIDVDATRRTAGLSPCVAGGMLVCPVGSSLVVAADPATRSLVWGSDRRSTDENAGRNDPVMPGVEDFLVVPPQDDAPPGVVAAGNRLLIVSRQGWVVAIDPLGGGVAWEAWTRGTPSCIGVDQSLAFVQAPPGIVAIRLADGMRAWHRAAAIGPPSGRAVIVGNRLYAPLADTTIAVLDTATGHAVASILSPHDEAFGNLIAVGRTLVSQSATRIVALPIPE